MIHEEDSTIWNIDFDSLYRRRCIWLDVLNKVNPYIAISSKSRQDYPPHTAQQPAIENGPIVRPGTYSLPNKLIEQSPSPDELYIAQLMYADNVRFTILRLSMGAPATGCIWTKNCLASPDIGSRI